MSKVQSENNFGLSVESDKVEKEIQMKIHIKHQPPTAFAITEARQHHQKILNGLSCRKRLLERIYAGLIQRATL